MLMGNKLCSRCVKNDFKVKLMRLAICKLKDIRMERCIWNFGAGTYWSLFPGGKACVV
jgi:hypothetical protein